jgi:hypothetical protein
MAQADATARKMVESGSQGDAGRVNANALIDVLRSRLRTSQDWAVRLVSEPRERSTGEFSRRVWTHGSIGAPSTSASKT